MIRFTMGEDAAAGMVVCVDEKTGKLRPVIMGDAVSEPKEPEQEYKFQCNRPRCMHIFDKAVRRSTPKGSILCCPKCLLDGFTIRKPKSRGMTFMEAVAAMKEGKEVRRNEWNTTYAIHFTENTGFISCGKENTLTNPDREDFEATDWEVV